MQGMQRQFRTCTEKKGRGFGEHRPRKQCTNKGMMSDSWRHEWVSRMNNKLISGLKLR